MRRLFCFFLVLFSMPAWAAVVYNWQPYSSNGYTDYDGSPIKFSGQLLIDEVAWLKGQVSYEYHGVPIYGGTAPDPASPIIGINFGYLGVNFRMGSPGIHRASIDLKLGALAVGSIDIHDFNTELVMSGSSIWGIRHFNSDARPPCGGTWDSDPKYCNGMTGLWVLDLSTIPNRVPEPGTVALISIGAAFTIIARRYLFKNENIRSVAGLIL